MTSHGVLVFGLFERSIVLIIGLGFTMNGSHDAAYPVDSSEDIVEVVWA